MDVFLSGQCPEHAVVAVRGDLDLATADDLLLSLRGFLSAGGRGIGLDLSGVTFLDCSGLRPLIAVEQYASDLGLTICLVALSPAVARMLELIDLPPGSGYLADPARAVSARCPAGATRRSRRVCAVRHRLAAGSVRVRRARVGLTASAAAIRRPARPGR